MVYRQLSSVASCNLGADCGGLADITFLIDDSDSTKRPVPGNMTVVQYAPGVVDFIQTFIDNTDLGNVRISLLLFSDTARILTGFTDNSAVLSNALSSFIPEFQGTHTAEGIQLIAQQFSNLGRVGVLRSAIILLDGSSQNVAAASTQAAAAESQGINLVSAAFDIPIPIPELQMLSQDPAEAFKVTSDVLLSTLLRNITAIVCPVTSPTTTMDPVTTTAAPISYTNLCSSCQYFNGVGHVGHPTDCSFFIQCHLKETGLVATVKACSPGTLWNKPIEACDYPLNVVCDPCKSLSDGSQYANSVMCSAFWECAGKISQPMCCGVGQVFVPGSGCVADTGNTCNVACALEVTSPPSTTAAPCTKQALPSRPGFYREPIPGFGLMERPCPGGTEFVQSACSCSLIVTSNQPDACDLFVGIDFNNQISSDSSRNGFQLTTSPFVKYQGNDLSVFSGIEAVIASGIANVDFRHNVFLVSKFQALGSTTVNQSVVHNSPCKDSSQPSLLIMAHDGSSAGMLDVIFLVRTTDDVADTTITLSANKAAFLTAVLSYDGSVVEARLLDELGNVLDTGSRPATGFVSIRKGALNVGGQSCNTTNPFVGLIDFVRLYKCQPPNNATDDDVVDVITTAITTTTPTLPTTQLGPVVFASSKNIPTSSQVLASCLSGNYLNGNSHMSYSGDCARFVQCYTNDVSLTFTVKFCSFGSVWSSTLRACVVPVASDCDPCRGQADNTQFPYTIQCNTYWTCANQISQPRCCPVGELYVEGAGCQTDSGSQCSDTCPGVEASPTDIPCFFLVSSKGAGFYQTFVTGLGYQDVPCPRGTVFHLPTCGCHQDDSSANQVAACPAFLHIPFDNKTTSDISTQKFSADASPFLTFPDDSTALFSGFGYVLVPGLSSIEFKEHFALQVRFQAQSSLISGPPQVLIHNDGCTDQDGPSFKLSVADNIADSSFVDIGFQLQTANDVTPQSLLLTGPKLVILEATLKYNGSLITAILNDGVSTTSDTRTATGVIKLQSHGLNIGSGLCASYPAFKGLVDDVKVFVCKNPPI
ncbi:uncharacterized protein LOC121368622 [Gigantopelta aegis]|uniref:uncharacterized protein LOC121368622 n=1 Tax=Gigantopelta aegis TaxID=1735272 RepID=UPI001B88B8CE|nr:uncharacterized protein LOC121368622 [Gigantopelta aegis]